MMKYTFTVMTQHSIDYLMIPSRYKYFECYGYINGYYTRASHTVKAKLETWIKRVLADEKVNIITNAYINDVYGTETFDSYGILLDTTNAEIDFTSSDEAGNFAELVNKLYFNFN